MKLDSVSIERYSERAHRAVVHRALGDETRLAIVDALGTGDHTSARLAELTGLRTNLLAFHLEVLEQAGLVSRHRSEGDRRRRYVTLTPAGVRHVGPFAPLSVACVLFVCTHNAARSQLAAALWRRRSQADAVSAGTQPAERVHPQAVAVAAENGLDLSDHRPRHVDDVDRVPDLVVSVCDRANESGLPFSVEHRHWSVPDPVGHDRTAFAAAYQQLTDRIERLAVETAA